MLAATEGTAILQTIYARTHEDPRKSWKGLNLEFLALGRDSVQIPAPKATGPVTIGIGIGIGCGLTGVKRQLRLEARYRLPVLVRRRPAGNYDASFRGCPFAALPRCEYDFSHQPFTPLI